MRTIKIIEHISLDGVISPGGPGEYGDEYAHGGWTAPYRSPAGAAESLEWGPFEGLGPGLARGLVQQRQSTQSGRHRARLQPGEKVQHPHRLPGLVSL